MCRCRRQWLHSGSWPWMSSGHEDGKRTCASRASTLLTRRATCSTSSRSSRHRHRRFFCDSIVTGLEPTSRTNLNETLQRTLEADGAQLLDVPGEAHEQVVRVEVHGRYVEDMLARVLLRFGQTFGPVGSNASTRPWKPRTPSLEGAATALSR